jgi:hypothetical protein
VRSSHPPDVVKQLQHEIDRFNRMRERSAGSFAIK